ncbi:MAG: family transporter [Rhodospirillales bacterium]|nr:family transporter [Rhodospirillales bacterium]
MNELPPTTDTTLNARVQSAISRTNRSQRIATVIVDIALVGLGFWVLSGFFGALAWAVVLTLATWPLYDRFRSAFAPQRRGTLAPALFTLLIALVFIIPFGVGVVEIWREMNALLHWITGAEKNGLPVPAMVSRLPFFSQQIAGWWQSNLAEPGAITDLIGRTDTGKFARLTQEISLVIARRLTFFAFTILTLFFLFRDGIALGKRFQTLCNRLLGEPGEYLATLTVTAVRSTADGLVLVGLGEGAFLGVAYALFGVPHPALLGAFTGLLAMIPFGAPIIFTVASALLLFKGSVGAAIGLFAFGWVVVGVADHAIRPVLIGGAAKLPFLWVLLGIFGGLETFGLVGLFLGPAIMAALVSLWREWTDPVPRRLNLKASG